MTRYFNIIIAESVKHAYDGVETLIHMRQLEEYSSWRMLADLDRTMLLEINDNFAIKGYFVGKWWRVSANLELIPSLRAMLDPAQLPAFDAAVAGRPMLETTVDKYVNNKFVADASSGLDASLLTGTGTATGVSARGMGAVSWEEVMVAMRGAGINIDVDEDEDKS